MKEQADLSGIGHKDYMDTVWWHYLPLYIFVALAIIDLILMVFAGSNAGGILVFVIGAVLMGLLIWWVCNIGELGWAWFILLLPLIIATLAATVASGVTMGMIGYDMSKSMRA